MITDTAQDRVKARSRALHAKKGLHWPCLDCWPEDTVLARLDIISARLDRIDATFDTPWQVSP